MDKYYAGQIVISKQGKDAGVFYVVTGVYDNEKTGAKRLALADAVRFNVSHPKMKNPAHVQITRKSVYNDELAELIKQGKNIDRGRLCQILASFKNASV